MKNTFFSIICVLFFLASCSMNHMSDTNSDRADSNQAVENKSTAENSTAALDYREPSQDPPNRISPRDFPQFIILAVEDNQYADGVAEILSVLEGKTNPAGTQNPYTYDGTPIHASFYNVPAGRDNVTEWNVTAETIQQWKRAYQLGHEIGVHTYYHEHGLQFTRARWVEEMQKCIDFHVSQVGIPGNEIVGFKTPFAEYNPDTFLAMQDVGLTYDISFEGGWRYWPAEDGSTLFWPFTMDSGNPPGESGRALPKVPGLWEMPNDCIFLPDGTRTSGNDTALWFTKSFNESQFVEALKYSLDKKYYGNRSPMVFGINSHYYSPRAIEDIKRYNPDFYILLKSSIVDRKKALDQFIQYALTLPDVRIVSAKEALSLIRNPVVPPPERFTITATSGPEGSWDIEGAIMVFAGNSLTLTPMADPSYEVDKIFVDAKEVPYDPVINPAFTLPNIFADHTVHVTFKPVQPQKTYTITATSGPNGRWDKTGAIVVAENSTLTLTPLPDKGYEVDKIYLDGKEVPLDPIVIPGITLPNISADHTVHVTFKLIGSSVVKTEYIINGDWGSGFGSTIDLTNTSNEPVSPKEIRMTFPGDSVEITTMWGATFTKSGGTYILKLQSWNSVINPGSKVSIGFNGKYSPGQLVFPEIIVVL